MSASLPFMHVLLEWTFMPPDFLVGHAAPAHDGYFLTFTKGKIEARIEADQWTAEPGIQGRIQRELETSLLALGMLRHKAVSLSEPSKTEVLADGRRIMYAEIRETIVIADRMEWQLVDADGKVVRDSVQERLEEERALLSRAGVHGHDPVLRKMLDCSYSAQLDPANELVHLYEIFEALATRFKGQHKARRILGVIDADWSYLGRLANNELLRQGRHRGKTLGEFRDATAEELSNCRRVARILIEAYLAFLDKSGTTQPP